MGRQQSTEQRKADILAAALSCFAQRGVAKTTMADICRRASASIGSVYHHFQSKEQLAAELYLHGIRRAQETSLGALGAQPSARDAVRSLVLSYLDWVQDNPDLSRFLLSERHAEFMALAKPALSAMNQQFRDAITRHLAEHVRRGELLELRPEAYSALLVGPAEHLARQWLTGRLPEGLAPAKAQLADAVWRSLAVE